MPPRKGGNRGRPSAPPLPVPTTYPPKKDDGSGMDDAQWMACRDMLEAVYKSKEGNRRMCEIFRELPDKEEWADYYDAIPEPECLDNIASRLANQTFNTPEEFFRQLHLVFLNAMHYNEEGSQIWNDAKKFEGSIHDAWRAHAEQGVFANADPKAKGGRGRKSSAKAAAPGTPSAPSSSAAATASTPPVTIHLRVPKAEEATPAPAPKDTPPSRTRETPRRGSSRQAAAAASPQKVMPPRAAKAEPAPPVSLTPVNTSALAASEKAIVDALDARLPKWEGPRSLLPGDPAPGGILGSGWWGEGSPDYELRVGGQASWKSRIRAVADAIDAYKDTNGVRLAETFGRIPEGAEIPYLPSTNHISWAIIFARARGSGYATLHDFDKDMTRLFDKARRWFRCVPDEFGAVLTLQRLYNAVTAPYPLQIPPNAVIPPSATKFASLPAGPGVARSVQDTNEALRAGASQEQAGYGVTTSRILTKDRHFTDEARHKGVSYRVGDYVHLINPDDASRPIVAQIFKTFVPTKGYSTHHVTVCWYFRPEQTTHPVEQMFTENEVFKTAHFCDHPVEDILERVAVQPTESASLGRPRHPAFYPGWPLYVYSMRYIDKACLFMRIKKWSNALPEQLRGTDPTVVVPYERPISLATVKSPFALGVTGPGTVGRPKRQPTHADDEEEEAAAAVVAIAPPVARRPSGQQSVDPRSRAPTTPSTPGPAPQQRHPYPAAQAQPGPSRTLQTASAYGSPAPQQPGRPAAPPATYRPPPPQPPLYAVRTFAAVMGGAQVLEQVAVKEYLHTETARLFEQDARHQVLWFSGPPLAPGALKVPTPPPHSLEYLSFLSKRKNGASVNDARPPKRFRGAVKDGEEDVDAEGEEDAEGEDDEEHKEKKDEAQDELDGDLSRHWWAQGRTEEQVLADLRAVAGVV